VKRNAILGILAVSSLALSGVAVAQSTTPTDPATAPSTTKEEPASDKAAQPATPAQPADQSTQPATPAQPATPSAAAEKANKPPASIDAIKEKAKTLSAKERESADQEIGAEVKKVNAEATAKGEITVATRLGEEFGVSADGLVAEKAHFKTGWGDLMIGHTLLANSTTSMTLQQLFDLRQGGMGWGEIAHGMDLKVGELISAAQAETRVATGLSKPDGKVEPVGHGVAARAQASAKVAAKAQPGDTPVRANMGVGAGVGVGRAKGGK
jgi:type IV secretory pathway VirB10-like protein